MQLQAGTPHAVSFPGSERARFLDVHTPSCGLGAFLRALGQAKDDEAGAAARAAFDQIPASPR